MRIGRWVWPITSAMHMYVNYDPMISLTSVGIFVLGTWVALGCFGVKSTLRRHAASWLFFEQHHHCSAEVLAL